MNELVVRTVTGLILIAAALVAAVVGGNLLAVFVAAIATLMFYEWTRIVRGWGAGLARRRLCLRFASRHWPCCGSASATCTVSTLLIWTFIVTWSTDIGAYFAGRSFGKRKLAPTISPNKTVEGLYGGIAAATLLGGAWAMATGLGTPLLALAPVLAVAAQGGDLFESGMKRRAGVKDSGAWLPGHGGALDRLDGLVPVAVLTAAAQLLGLT